MNYWGTILDFHKIKYTRDNIRYLYEMIWRGILQDNIRATENIHFNDMLISSTEDEYRKIYSINSMPLLIILDKKDEDLYNVATFLRLSEDLCDIRDLSNAIQKDEELLKNGINFIKSKKTFITDTKIMKINKILITDDLYINCCNDKIEFVKLNILMNKPLYYMNYGFFPIGLNINSGDDNKFYNDMILQNKTIMNSITIEESKISNYIFEIKQTEDNIKSISNIIDFIQANKNKLLKYLYRELKDNYQLYSNIIGSLVWFHNDIKLYPFFKETFILKFI